MGYFIFWAEIPIWFYDLLCAFFFKIHSIAYLSISILRLEIEKCMFLFTKYFKKCLIYFLLTTVISNIILFYIPLFISLNASRILESVRVVWSNLYIIHIWQHHTVISILLLGLTDCRAILIGHLGTFDPNFSRLP
jgi:hypothetical protein